MRIHRDHTGTGGIDRYRLDRIAFDSGTRKRRVHRFRQRPQVLGVTLGGMIRIVALADQRVFRGARAQPAVRTIKNGDPDA